MRNGAQTFDRLVQRLKSEAGEFEHTVLGEFYCQLTAVFVDLTMQIRDERAGRQAAERRAEHAISLADRVSRNMDGLIAGGNQLCDWLEIAAAREDAGLDRPSRTTDTGTTASPGQEPQAPGWPEGVRLTSLEAFRRPLDARRPAPELGAGAG